jgi:hypothetical protein
MHAELQSELRRQAEQAEAAERERGRMHAELQSELRRQAEQAEAAERERGRMHAELQSGRLRRLRRQAEQAEAAERERGRMHAELGQAATSAVTHGKHAAPSDEQSPIKARLTPSPTR